jgi:hypothetical protein
VAKWRVRDDPTILRGVIARGATSGLALALELMSDEERGRFIDLTVEFLLLVRRQTVSALMSDRMDAAFNVTDGKI